MTTFSQDLWYAWRALWKRPGFALVAIATLALGIGANTAIFSVVQGIVLEPLPYPASERLVTVWENHEARGGPASEWTGRANFVDWRVHNRVLDGLAVYSGWGPALTGDGVPEILAGEIVSFEYLSVLGVAPAIGRDFFAEEETPGGERVVVLGADLWKRRFGADPGIVGAGLTLNGEPATVVGVLPAGFRSPFNPGAEIWTVLTIEPGVGDRGNYYLRTLGRLRPGIDLDAAGADFARVARLVAEAHPDEYADVGATVTPLLDTIVGRGRPALLALMGAVGLVLLIACANVANLLLARATAREQEMAIRASLGAGRGRLVRQLLTESTVLALIGGGLGLLLGSWGTALLKTLAPSAAPRLDQVGLNLEVLLFTLTLALLTGVLFGLVPALQASRSDLAGTLRDGTRNAGGGSNLLRGFLVIAEVALALTLLVGAGLLIRSFWLLTRVDPGFRPQQVMTANLALPRASYDTDEKTAAFYDRLTDRLAERPELAASGAVSVLPMAPGGDSDVTITIEGRPPLAFADQLAAWYRQTTPGYFDAMGMRIVRGRGFSPRDRADSMPVVLVNETLARDFFPGEDPVGQRLKQGGPDSPDPWRTIVGIVGDVRYRGLGEETVDEIYLPQSQLPSRRMAVVLRPRSDAADPLAVLRAEVEALDPDLPVFAPATMASLVADSVALPRFTTWLLMAFAALALTLAAIGIYGVLTYAVSQRTREIGVRMALGAERRHVVRLVVSRGLGLTLAGVGLGWLAAFAVSRFLEQLLFGVRPTDPGTFAVTAAVLLAVAALACWLPARRAARVDPVVSLRQ